MAKLKLSKREKLLLVIFVVAAFVGLVMIKQSKMDREERRAVVQEESSGTSPVSGGTVNQAKTYTQLVAQYKDKRIQFDINCQAVPNYVTFKSGTKVMFDNRSGDARVITIGGVKYNFPGYGYKVLTLYSGSLPKTLFLSCGGAVNVGQILLQR